MNLDAIEDFLARVKKLPRNNREMRLSFDEANALVLNIAELMAMVAKKSSDTVLVPPTVLDGGGFTD